MLPVKMMEKIINQLETLSNYDGAWEGFVSVAKKLKYRIDELKERAAQIESLLIIAIVGGSGVGKSTLINAIAGDKIAKTSQFRPCTDRPIIYHPPDWEPNAEFKAECISVPRSTLENIVIIDTPDTDTVIKEHREFTKKVLAKCDLILLCGFKDKYLEDATWSLIRELNNERSFVLVETRLENLDDSIMSDWLEKLKNEQIFPLATFRVNALRALDGKLGNASEGNEFDFGKLERFLAQQLTEQKILQIKTNNVSGLAKNAIENLTSFVEDVQPSITELEEFINHKKVELALHSEKIIKSEFNREIGTFYRWLKRFIAPHLYGIFLVIARLREFLLSLPGKINPLNFIRGSFRSFAKHDETVSPFEEELYSIIIKMASQISERSENKLSGIQSELMFILDKAQVRKDIMPPLIDNFKVSFYERAKNFLQENIYNHLEQKARCLSNYFLIQLFYLPMYVVIGFIFWRVFPGYFLGKYQGLDFILHSLLILFASIFFSYWIYDKIVFLSSRNLEKKSAKQFIASLSNIISPFDELEKSLNEAKNIIQVILKIKNDFNSLQ